MKQVLLKIYKKKHKAELEQLEIDIIANAQKEIEDAKKKAFEQAQSRLALKINELQEESAADKKDNQELREAVLSY